MSLNAASNRNGKSTNAGPDGVQRLPLSTSHLPPAGNAPTLAGTNTDRVSLLAGADSELTSAQRTRLNTLREGAQALRWPDNDPDAAATVDVPAYFRSVKTSAAQLHEIGQTHPASPQLASWIKAFEGALGRLNAALRRGADKGGLDAVAFDTEALRDIFGALSAFADPARASLFNRQQRRALQPLLQNLTTTLLQAAAKGFASSATVAEHLPLLNWICRGVKKGLLKPDDGIAKVFEGALNGLVGWVGADDQDAQAYQIGECAAILKDVIEYDLLALKAKGEAGAEVSHKLKQCMEELCGAHSYAVLEKAPVNGVSVMNVCNLVKELIGTQALSIDELQRNGQLQRLLTLIEEIPNEQMSGGDGRVLSNAGNFLRLLMRRASEGPVGDKELHERVSKVARRVLAALNAEGFGKGRRNAQSLANLVSFMQDCHEHLLPACGDEVMRKSFARALDKLLAKLVAGGAAAFSDGRTIDGLLLALAYLQEQGLCIGTAGLEELREDLLDKQNGVERARPATPVLLSGLGAQLPSVTTPPKLTLNQETEQTKADEPRKRIPGEGAIVAQPRLMEPARSGPSTSYLRPTVGRGKFAHARSAKTDAFSLAAHDALAETVNADDIDSDDEQQDLTEALPKTPSKDIAVANSSVKPQAPAGVVDVEALVAALRAGQPQQTEQVMQQLRSLPQRRLPALPEAFLLELDSEAFLSDKMRFKACNTYLSNLSKQDRQNAIECFTKHPPTSSTLRELLIRHGIVKASESQHARNSGSVAVGGTPEHSAIDPPATAHRSSQAKPAAASSPQTSAEHRKQGGRAKAGGDTVIRDAADVGHNSKVRVKMQVFNGAELDDMNALIDAAPSEIPTRLRARIKQGMDLNAPTVIGMTPLMAAAQAGATELVSAMIKEGADVNVHTLNNQNALMCAASFGHTATVRELVRAGAKIDAVDANGVTALMLALAAGHIETVQALASLGANVDAAALGGETSLMRVIEMGRMSSVRTLIDLGANVNAAAPGGATALMLAVRKGLMAIFRALLQADADVNAVDAANVNPLMIAAAKGRSDMVWELARAGADVNATTPNGVTAVMFAAEKGHTATVEALKELGANLNARTLEGTTAMMRAAMAGDTAMVQTLAHAGADVDAARPNGITALIFAADKGHTATVKALKKLGANVNAAASDGLTALMQAAKTGKTAMASLLIELKADVNAHMTFGTTALMFAAARGDTAMVRALAKAGANVNAAMTDGVIALMLAVLKGHTTTVQALVKLKANVNAAMVEGTTALMMAAENGDTSMVKALLLAGARLDMVDINGQTALSMAKEGGHGEVVKLLQARQKS